MIELLSGERPERTGIPRPAIFPAESTCINSETYLSQVLHLQNVNTNPYIVLCQFPEHIF